MRHGDRMAKLVLGSVATEKETGRKILEVGTPVERVAGAAKPLPTIDSLPSQNLITLICLFQFQFLGPVN